MKITVISDKKNEQVANELVKKIISTNKIECIPTNISDEFFATMDVAVNKIATHIVDRVIVIDDFGILPFMYMSKNKNMVVAQISDEHSGHMTAEHNGSNCITLPSKILAVEQLFNVSMQYLLDKYAGGRHESRIDMLKAQLKGEQ